MTKSFISIWLCLALTLQPLLGSAASSSSDHWIIAPWSLQNAEQEKLSEELVKGLAASGIIISSPKALAPVVFKNILESHHESGPGDRLFSEAENLYFDYRLDLALTTVDRALIAYGQASRQFHGVLKAQILKSQILLDQGREADARRCLKELAFSQPWMRDLTDGGFSPAVQSLYKNVVSQLDQGNEWVTLTLEAQHPTIFSVGDSYLGFGERYEFKVWKGVHVPLRAGLGLKFESVLADRSKKIALNAQNPSENLIESVAKKILVQQGSVKRQAIVQWLSAKTKQVSVQFYDAQGQAVGQPMVADLKSFRDDYAGMAQGMMREAWGASQPKPKQLMATAVPNSEDAKPPKKKTSKAVLGVVIGVLVAGAGAAAALAMGGGGGGSTTASVNPDPTVSVSVAGPTP